MMMNEQTNTRFLTMKDRYQDGEGGYGSLASRLINRRDSIAEYCRYRIEWKIALLALPLRGDPGRDATSKVQQLLDDRSALE
jgi:hypothetical protein